MGKTPEEKAAKKAKKAAKAAKLAAKAQGDATPPLSPADEKAARKAAKKEKKRKAAEAEAAGASQVDDKAARKAAKKAKKEAKAAAAAAEETPKEAPPTPTNGDEVKSVFCTNLAWAIDDDAIKAHFADAGQIRNIKWIEDRDTGKFKGMGVLEFADAATALKAVELKNETEVLGRTMYCRLDKLKPKSDRPVRQPKAKPDGCCKLYCGNLSYDIDDAALRAFFEPLALSAIRWVTDRETGDFKGCGFAEFASTEDADEAFKKQGQVLMSRPVRLDWAEDKPRKWEQ
jgi:nucleolin